MVWSSLAGATLEVHSLRQVSRLQNFWKAEYFCSVMSMQPYIRISSLYTVYVNNIVLYGLICYCDKLLGNSTLSLVSWPANFWCQLYLSTTSCSACEPVWDEISLHSHVSGVAKNSANVCTWCWFIVIKPWTCKIAVFFVHFPKVVHCGTVGNLGCTFLEIRAIITITFVVSKLLFCTNCNGISRVWLSFSAYEKQPQSQTIASFVLHNESILKNGQRL